MTGKSAELGISPMYRILKKSGAGRVSDESAAELRRITEDLAESIARGGGRAWPPTRGARP